MFEDPRLAISLGTTLCTLAAAFGVVRWEVRNLNKVINDMENRLRDSDKIADGQEVAIQNLIQRADVTSSMLAPSEREMRAREVATIKSELATAIRDLEVIKKMHNGEHK
jgi:hypothetical protein